MSINILEVMKNFKDIQGKVGEMQTKLSLIKEEGTACGDMVKVEINGVMEVTDVRISKELIGKNDNEMLEEFIKVAANNALSKIREKIKGEVSSLTGGINLPADFPFANGTFPLG